MSLVVVFNRGRVESRAGTAGVEELECPLRRSRCGQQRPEIAGHWSLRTRTGPLQAGRQQFGSHGGGVCAPRRLPWPGNGPCRLGRCRGVAQAGVVSILSASGTRIEDISDLMGHSSTSVTETVYRHEIRPALTTGATAMDKILGKKRTKSA